MSDPTADAMGPESGSAPALPAAATRPGRAMAIAAAVLLFVAAAGVAGGVALERLVLAPRAFAAGRPPEGGWGRRGGFLGGGERGRPSRDAQERFRREFGITDEQDRRIQAILDRQTPRIDSVRGEMRPRLQALIEETRRQIDSVLTPEQRERIHAAERQRHRRGPGPGGPPPGPPPGEPPPERPGPAL
ncbi:MAG: hypothetical protein ACJ79S_19520 [Gemmatimonadaceae bacterium]